MKQVTKDTFFALLRAGLWEKEVWLSQFQRVDFSEVYQLAAEQSVVGIVSAGLELVKDMKIPQNTVLQFVGDTLQIEHRNKAMNEYLSQLIARLRKDDVYGVLVKGQGLAQCYERPLWRASGDVDFLFTLGNYEKAKKVLIPLALSSEREMTTFKHLSMMMEEGFEVELHGTLHSRLSNRVDKVIDEAQVEVFYGGHVRSWQNGKTQTFLPGIDSDVIFIFTHILHHFYIEGIGLRQICDWCRFLWTYQEHLNLALLKQRLRRAGLMSEWQAFGAVAVEWLGMPKEAMPFYISSGSQSRKAKRIIVFVLETGNFGHNRHYNRSNNYLIGKIQSVWLKMKDFSRHALIFPLDSLRYFCHFLGDGMKLAKTMSRERKDKCGELQF